VWHLTGKTPPNKADFQKDVADLVREMQQKKADILIAEYLRARWKELGSRIKIEANYE
jgi:hypothetical protein